MTHTTRFTLPTMLPSDGHVSNKKSGLALIINGIHASVSGIPDTDQLSHVFKNSHKEYFVLHNGYEHVDEYGLHIGRKKQLYVAENVVFETLSNSIEYEFNGEKGKIILPALDEYNRYCNIYKEKRQFLEQLF